VDSSLGLVTPFSVNGGRSMGIGTSGSTLTFTFSKFSPLRSRNAKPFTSIEKLEVSGSELTRVWSTSHLVGLEVDDPTIECITVLKNKIPVSLIELVCMSKDCQM